MSNLAVLDLGVIAGYFLVLLGIGYWAARREKHVSADYFLAGRDVGWLAVRGAGCAGASAAASAAPPAGPPAPTRR